MTNSYHKHTVNDKRFLARRQRREKAMELLPLLGTLCLFIGFALLALSLAVFRHADLTRWLQFSMFYLLAGALFFAATRLIRVRERALERRRKL